MVGVVAVGEADCQSRTFPTLRSYIDATLTPLMKLHDRCEGTSRLVSLCLVKVKTGGTKLRVWIDTVLDGSMEVKSDKDDPAWALSYDLSWSRVRDMFAVRRKAEASASGAWIRVRDVD